ncbi:MAG: ABC transporter permease [Clostridia bacterium]|nr:ABC transporter permease [Clostridia bacterium]
MNMQANVPETESQAAETFWGGVFHRFVRNRVAMVSFFILLAIVLACIFVPIISPYGMESIDMSQIKLPPNAEHPLGTDDIGRDLLVRLFYGGRISLGIALAATAANCFLGVLLGSLAGYYGKWADAVIMRLCETFQSFPFLMICVTIAMVFGNSIPTLIFTLAILSWPSVARIVRGQILTLREMEYMEACEALGISDARRIFKHLLPNVLAYVIVYATLGMASVILTETALSFLGLGVSPPTPTWGNLIQAARETLIIKNKWWYWIPPGLAIFVSVMCFNLVGDGLRDAIDPKMKR